jgi:hypothetical protein
MADDGSKHKHGRPCRSAAVVITGRADRATIVDRLTDVGRKGKVTLQRSQDVSALVIQEKEKNP